MLASVLSGDFGRALSRSITQTGAERRKADTPLAPYADKVVPEIARQVCDGEPWERIERIPFAATLPWGCRA